MSLTSLLVRFRWLREYYRDVHLQVTLPGCALRDPQGELLGYLEEVRLREGRLHLRGWTLADELGLRLGDFRITRRPHLERTDVVQALGCDATVGFNLTLPFDDAPLLIELAHQGQRVTISHDLRITKARRRAEYRLRAAFLRDIVPVLPMIATGLMRRDTDLPRRVKTALRLAPVRNNCLLDRDFLAAPRPRAPAPSQPLGAAETPEITIILPVFNAADILPETLQRLRAHTDLSAHVVVIEDCSTDPRIRPMLQDWAAVQHERFRVTLIEHDANRGFVASVNEGFALCHETGGTGPVILLNSDAMVPDGWASRLVAPLADPQVASVTPMSNDAEIFSAPVQCHATALLPGQIDRIDAALQQIIAPDAPAICVPTGVGFCMALSRAWLQRLGGFDAVFGRGYGEEVDWCRRAAQAGGQHRAAPGLFVEHRGGASFGAAKQALVQQNGAIISARYPGYDRTVQDFIRADPLITPRMIAALHWADSLPDLQELPVFIAHSMGGGADAYLQERLKSADAAVVLRFGGSHRCSVEFYCPQGRLGADTDDLELIVQMLGPVHKRRIIYSCAVGDPDPGSLPDFLRRLAGPAPLQILFHDYLPLSPSYTLLDADGVYRGVPAIDSTDPAHICKSGSGPRLGLREWRARWGSLIEAAEKLVVFSTASAAIVTEAYPASRSKIDIRPHRLSHPLPRLHPRQRGKAVIGVLGAIGPQKGAAVVSALSRRIETGAGPGLAVIGRIAPGYPLGRSVAVHGAYAIQDIPDLVARHGITHWLIPSIWPETFCYTVHECLATGLPTLAFGLGAQGEAVTAAENGILLPWDQTRCAPEELAGRVLDAVSGCDMPTADPVGTPFA